MANYVLPLVHTLTHYDFPEMTVRIDSEVVDEEATFVVVGNMRRYGGPFRIFNSAAPDDGLLDVCCFHGHDMLQYLGMIWESFWHLLPTCPQAVYHRGRTVEIMSEAAALVQVDGDPGGVLPMRFGVLPGAVNFCVAPALN